ncbi:p-loop containing nucleoside triphosphate hydrolase protein [Chrysochromulina tobinii]|uniref:p-loop containing nucleoside triphosphate hydrolase protein n=1 Tax=Chrysochromulina tobinii TaxID=1460289 RepID=A0A0M0LQX0_9EUKA|nr:p-loop containing nucleoside triphosphate hydrolase protein [Chrysochromulina tobinii]|eukprot:KOO53391.1 p-loop containing nucleoside triphosphate hydrolase protein [Chrysochromulina sp. CCMP291]
MLKMLREANPGLQRRFSPESAFHFADFSDGQLEELLHRTAAAAGLKWSSRKVRKAALGLLIRERIQPNFGNAGSVNSLLGRVKSAVAARGDAREIILADLGLDENAAGGSAKTEALLAEVEAEMSELFKAEHLRAHFNDLAARLTTLEKDGELDASRPADKVGSYVFVGNPGTGKTTVAKVLAKWLRAKGVLVSDVVGEESALNLQGEYLGQTKEKVNKLMASAIGGLVFIDEAYNLGGSGGRRVSLYAQEAVDQLTYCMTEDTHKGRTIVVLAGYEREMNEMLANANPGFRSRFKQRIVMPDWDAADVVEYLRRRCTKKGIVLADAAQRVLLGGIDDVRERLLIAADCHVRKRPGWANARDAERLYDELEGLRAVRRASAGDEEERPTFTEQDAISALLAFDKLRPPA